MSLISKLPKALVDDIRNGRCLPIIGSGFSKNAIVREGRESPPDWNGLALRLLHEASEQGATHSAHVCNPLEVMSAFVERFGRVKLVEVLHDILWDGIVPGKVHDAFAKVPFDIVCTTNYDFLLEEAYRSAGVPFKPLINETDLCMASPKGFTVVLKPHGDLNHPDRLVLTEEDYDRFIAENPLLCTFLANQLIIKTPLFLGYSVEDTNFRQIWQVIKTRLGKLFRRGYRIAIRDDETTIATFRRRGITVINLGGDSYEDSYFDLFSEMKDLLSKDATANLSNLDNDLAAALKEEKNRIVVFAIPTNLVSFYKENIFPLVARLQCVPIAFQDLTAAMGSFNANLYTVIDKSAAIVVDEETEERFIVFGFALRKLTESTILTIKVRDAKRHDLPGTPYIVRPSNPYTSDASEIKELTTRINEWLKTNLVRDMTVSTGVSTTGTDLLPRLLVTWNEAVSLLSELIGPLPTTLQFDAAVQRNLITQSEREELARIMQLRNSVVHSDVTFKDPDTASNAIQFLERLIKKLRKKPRSLDE